MGKSEPLNLLVIGAGNRGMYTYGELAKREDIHVNIVGVAEIDKKKREKMAKEHDIPSIRCFKTGREALNAPKFCSTIINATPDKEHFRITMEALKKGYNVLLEKPMATNLEECRMIAEAQGESKSVVSLAHVLRYTSFFQRIKEILDSGEMGKLLNIDLLEEVGYWHYAHSYVRGNWRKEKESGPIILTKSCHDLDILSYLVDSEIETVSSKGSLEYFKKENAPKGSKKRCTHRCRVKSKCPYNAEKFYLTEKDPDKIHYPINVISLDKSVKSRRKAIEKGPYGRCVFRCDNDVCDNQIVEIGFKNKINATFRLSAFGERHTRKIKIYLEKGEIKGDLAGGSIKIVKYHGTEKDNSVTEENVSGRGSHGGGDEFLLKNFVKAINKKNKDANLTTIGDTFRSHLLAFAAEESRKTGEEIDFQKFKKNLTSNSLLFPMIKKFAGNNDKKEE